MPEITDAQLTEYHQYKAIAPTPAEVTRKIEDAIKDNGKQRDEIRELKEKVKTLPAEGAVVIPPGEEANTYAAWKALDLKPEDVAKVTKERDDLAAEKQTRERKDAFAKVAKLHGMPEDAAATMAGLLLFQGASFEFKPAKAKDKAGKDVDTEEVHVTLSGEGQKQQKFSELLGTAPELKGIRTEAGNGSGEASGIVVHEMRGSGGESKTSAAGGIDDLIARNQAAATAGNPLAPKKAAA